MPIEMLTYDAFGTRLEISAEAARAVARRLRLPRSRSSDGKALVAVDVNEIKHRRRTPVGRAVEIAALREEIVQLASTVAMHRADFERAREHADHLAVELATLAADAMSAKETARRLEGELAALRIGVREQPPSRLGRLAAAVVAADRSACR
jgi:chromosome segregation ATPase